MRGSTLSVVIGVATSLALLSACSEGEDARSTGTGGSAGMGKGGSGGGTGGKGGSAGSSAQGGGTGGTNGGSGGNAGSTAAAGGNGGGGTSGSGGTTGSAGDAPVAGAGGAGDEPVVCDGDCHYVRSGATGANDGSTWTDAFTELPQELERGHTYFVAAGSYPAYTFDDAASGMAVTRVLRATAENHGSVADWDPSYAGGEATFGGLVFESDDYEFDGARATRVVGEFEGTVVAIGGDRVAFRNVDVDGAFAMTGDMHTVGACTGMEISGSSVIVSGSRIHDAADDGVVVGGSDDLDFEGNEIDSLHGCGTDGNCGPCDNGHSDGLEIYAVTNSRFVGNFAHDIESTSTFFFGNWADTLGDGPADYCENILIANNILYNPETGFVIYIEDARGVRLHHNTIWGRHDGAYGGLAIGIDVTGLELFNNVILSINHAHLASTFDPAEHGGDHNVFGKSLGQWTDGANDVVANDPEFSGIPDGDGAEVDGARPADFTPGAGSAAKGLGTSDASLALPSVDFFGTARGSPPTAGAIE